MKKNNLSSYKLPKQQTTSFWSQGISGAIYPLINYSSSHSLIFGENDSLNYFKNYKYGKKAQSILVVL
jgi:hypothetical protein